MKFDAQKMMITESGRGRNLLIAGVVGLILAAVGAFVNSERFFHAYLIGVLYWTSIGLGGLFFTMLHHLTGASWSVVIRRISETLMATLPICALLFIPILFGLHHLYEWARPEAVTGDHLLQMKSAFLNPIFFIIRTVIYFAVWILLGRALYNASRRQDMEPEKEHLQKMRNLSGGGMVLFALTITFAGFDWLMSLNPHWYSTIFGAYFFAGSLISVLAMLTTLAIYFNRQGILADKITKEHYHDLGKLMFAFTVFWGYIGGSQYFIIWYGNLPEETVWYLVRWEGSWKYVTMVIIFGHFAVPFTSLLFQTVKRKLGFMRFIAGWILLMHVVDLFWLVLPTYEQSHGNADFSWMDPVALIGVGGVAMWYFFRKFSSAPVLPVGDPYLDESINFKNV
jgi:hypothetical protein